jgi:hypothetical protein
MKRYRKAPSVAQPVETLVALRYPNGRVHETAVDRRLRPGERFEMYGRTWTAVQSKARRQQKDQPRTLCVPAASAYE